MDVCPRGPKVKFVSKLQLLANQVHNSDVVDFFFCYQRIFGVWVFVSKSKREGSVLTGNGMPTDSETKKGENEAKMTE